MDYKEQLVNQILGNCIGILDTNQTKQLASILNISLYKYEISLKVDCKDLPATIDSLNNELLNRFLVSKCVSGLSKKSIELYKFRLTKFIISLNKRITDVNSDDIKFFFAMFKMKNGSSNTTMENYRSILSSFFKWLVNNDYIDKNPMRNIERIKKDTIKDDPFSNIELEKIRNTCRNLRDRTIVEFLLSTGCRVSELVSLNIEQIKEDNKISIIGKGNKQRYIYISDISKMYINEYLNTRSDNENALFITNNKPYKRLSIDGVENMLKRIERESGVKNIHPHRFRRTFCCNMIDRGANLKTVSDIMGHSQLDTTMEYYNSTDRNIKNEYDKFNNI